MYAAILAGGVGTRLWPRSRQANPKQFADITGAGRTMIQATVDRLAGLVPGERIYVVTGKAYEGLAVAQLPEVAPAQILAEPSGRNTAPAIGLACVHLRRRDPQAVLVVLPADHVIPHAAAFQAALQRAAVAAEAGRLVTLGIEPHFPHTGYGYIKRSRRLRELPEDELPIYAVERFLEKPDLATAERFLREGGYYWNGGIFIARVDVMLGEIERQIPEVYRRLQQIEAALDTPDLEAVTAAAWADMPSISIDYGVMEGAQQVAMVPLQAGWNDVGSWDALQSVLEHDENKNIVARGQALSVDSFGNIVFSDKKMVALVGVDDLVIVEDGDTLLIGRMNQMQKVKNVVDLLRRQGREDLV